MLNDLGVLLRVAHHLSVLRKETLCLRPRFESDESKMGSCGVGFSCAWLCKLLCKSLLALPRSKIFPLQPGQAVDLTPESR